MADPASLWRAARRAADRPFFLASALLAYARAERLDMDALARWLGCEPAALPLLLLCRRPAGDSPAFRSEVQHLAERFGLDAARLAEAIRLADALGKLGQAADHHLLAAARDRADEIEETER